MLMKICCMSVPQDMLGFPSSRSAPSEEDGSMLLDDFAGHRGLKLVSRHFVSGDEGYHDGADRC